MANGLRGGVYCNVLHSDYDKWSNYNTFIRQVMIWQKNAYSLKSMHAFSDIQWHSYRLKDYLYNDAKTNKTITYKHYLLYGWLIDRGTFMHFTIHTYPKTDNWSDEVKWAAAEEIACIPSAPSEQPHKLQHKAFSSISKYFMIQI